MERLPKKYFGSISDYVKTYYTAWGVTNFADNAYTAIKTVTKDFTRTDPVFVRVGEDGEPEIHYTFDGSAPYYSSYFQNMDLGNAHFYLHNGKAANSLFATFNNFSAHDITIDSCSGSDTISQIFSYYRQLSGGPEEWRLKEITILDPSLSAQVQGNDKMSYIFYGHMGLERINFPNGIWDTSKITSAGEPFAALRSLKEMPAFDLSGMTSCSNVMHQCYSLEAFHCTGMKFSMDFSPSKMKHDAILEVFNNLGTVDKTAGITLTLGSAKLALMSDAEKAIATEKGWTLA